MAFNPNQSSSTTGNNTLEQAAFINADYYEQQQLREQIESQKSTREMREKYADMAYRFAKWTLVFWGIIVFLYILAPDKARILPDKIFIAITTACTVNILVAFHAVIKGLFSYRDK